MRRECRFYEDKLVAKTKSLSVEFEEEVGYDRISAIENRSRRDVNWLWAAFILAGIVCIAWVIIPDLGISRDNPTVTLVEKAAVVAVYLMAIPAFRKFEWFSFVDADGKYLATVIVSKRSRKTMLEAIDLVKRQNKNVRETYITDPLPSVSPRFEITDLDVPNFLNRSTVRFYDDRLIDMEKSWVGESVNVVAYKDIAQGTRTAKIGNDGWDVVFTYWLILITVSLVTALVFFSRQVCGNLPFARAVIAACVLLIPIFLVRYLKREVLIFSNKRGEIAFWTYIRTSNREELMRAVAFVEGKKALS